MQAIVYQLLSGGNENFTHISQFSPFYEVDRTWMGNVISPQYQENHNNLGIRIFNTHLRWSIMPKGSAAKYIYVYRNGKDVCASFFHHLTNQADSGPYEGTFDEFVKDWCDNKIIFGNWMKHLKSWLEL
jgi:hypothetical protein